jgi:hypothetical protein
MPSGMDSLTLGSSPSPGANTRIGRTAGRSGSPLAPRFFGLGRSFSRGTAPNWSRRGSELTAAAAASCAPWATWGVDLVGVLAMLIRGNLGLLPALPVAGSGMDRDHLRGILLTAHSRPEHHRPVAGPWPGVPPHGSAEVFLPLATAISWVRFSGAWFFGGVVRVADFKAELPLSGTARRGRGARDTG